MIWRAYTTYLPTGIEYFSSTGFGQEVIATFERVQYAINHSFSMSQDPYFSPGFSTYGMYVYVCMYKTPVWL